LPGLYQEKNIKTVLAAIGIINTTTSFKINSRQLKSGLMNVKKNTGLFGRWQIIKHKPLIIYDTGHNEAGIKEVVKNIKNTKHDKLHIVLGMVNDKDINHVLKILPKNASYYFCKASIPRALDENILYREASKERLKGVCFSDVKSALKSALNNANKNDLIFVGGSTFTVANALKIKKLSN
jgi:dihydrofolate synthase/folylpolyglutamate synthase